MKYSAGCAATPTNSPQTRSTTLTFVSRRLAKSTDLLLLSTFLVMAVAVWCVTAAGQPGQSSCQPVCSPCAKESSTSAAVLVPQQQSDKHDIKQPPTLQCTRRTDTNRASTGRTTQQQTQSTTGRDSSSKRQAADRDAPEDGDQEQQQRKRHGRPPVGCSGNGGELVAGPDRWNCCPGFSLT